MALEKVAFILCFVFVDSFLIDERNSNDIRQVNVDGNIFNQSEVYFNGDENIEGGDTAAQEFNGVYTECFLHLSYACLQKKTLSYLEKLNNLSEVTVIGDYVKFVKTNTTYSDDLSKTENEEDNNADLSSKIDNAISSFFDSHFLRISSLGKDIMFPKPAGDFVGRKKRKGGGGGGGGGGGHHGGDDDGGKKKMMMMAMTCMKMKFMMMMPAMMGMMGMISFKGMMFSMMSFMMSKMMVMMHFLEKKHHMGGGGGGGGGDGGWASGGGGGGAWMPAGGSDSGGGYDSNGQWQSRSILETVPEEQYLALEDKPIITYVTPSVRYSSKIISDNNKYYTTDRTENVADDTKVKSRRKRGIMDVLESAYFYWLNRLIGKRTYASNKRTTPTFPKYRIINGVKYVYTTKAKNKLPKAVQYENNEPVKVEESAPIVTVEDFNKGEIFDPPEEGRMTKKKLSKLKETVDEAVEDNPWE